MKFMERRKMKERRDSTIPRHNQVHQLYDEVIKELGEFAYIVPRGEIYKRIRAKQGQSAMSGRWIAYILNHTRVT